MEIFEEINEFRAFCRHSKVSQKSIGFVPTMGALHQGHLALVNKSKLQNELTVCSIFVNPTQFNNPEDLQKYPRDIPADLKTLESIGCDAVFIPKTNQIYPQMPVVQLSFGNLEEIMEGQYRPGHFKGVGLIVCKLFNIVEPDRAYFGEKDFQQLCIIKKLTEELNFPIEIVPVKTIRESDGLAMSSRNLLLTTGERPHAADLYRALQMAEREIKRGANVGSVKRMISDFFTSKSKIRLEYFVIVHSADLTEITRVDKSTPLTMCIAGYLGKVRLIDNMSLF